MTNIQNSSAAGRHVSSVIVAIGALALLTAHPAITFAASTEISPGLIMPTMDPAKGKALFASKRCVVCHSVNGIGGTDAPKIDASTMKPEMSPFDFVARMWNHSMGMVAMQMHELGGQITFDNGQQIADIIAFLHDAKEQKTFSEADIPANVKSLLDGDEDSGPSGMMNGQMRPGMGGGMMGGGMMGGGTGRGMMQGN